MSLPVVILDLKIGSNPFIDILRTRATTIAARYTLAKFSRAKLFLSVPSPLVQWSAPNLIVRGRAQIIVRSKISSGILPLSISFAQVGGSDDPRGLFNFPLASRTMGLDGEYYFLCIVDEFYLHGPAGTYRWKCCVVIQKENGSIGIIDPHIENQD
jgi:hypothetical protein